jgi:hypothetical protein
VRWADNSAKSLKSGPADAGPSPVSKERRRKHRHAPAEWKSRYRLAGASGWRDCTLVDVSESGAGFQAYMLATDAVQLTSAELELIDDSGTGEGSIRLRGQVRHLTRSEEGHVRVGIEFVGLTELEGRLLGLLFGRDAFGRARQTLVPAPS